MDKILISLITGLSAMFSYGVGEFSAKKAVDKFGNIKTFFLIQILTLAIALILCIFVKIDFHITPLLLSLTLLITIFYSIAYISAYKGYSVGNLSVVSPIMSSYGAIAAILAYFFLGQRLEGMQIFGIPLVVLGIILVSIEIDPQKKISFTAGLGYAILTAVLFGINSVLVDYVVKRIDFLFFSLISISSGAVLMSVYFFLTRQSIRITKEQRPALIPLVLAAILTLLGNLSLIYGYTVGDAIIIAPLGSAAVVVTIILAVIFLKEKLQFVQISGIVLTILGIIFTAL